MSDFSIKFSLFGDFSKTHDDIPRVREIVGSEYGITMENEFDGRVVSPAFVFAGKQRQIRLGISRCDFEHHIDDAKAFVLVMDQIDSLTSCLPDYYFRVAINLNYIYGDKNLELLRRIVNKDSMVLGFGNVDEYSLRKNYKNILMGRDINNIITIQTTKSLNKRNLTFERTLSVTIDVNNTPINLVPSLEPISKMEIKPMFEGLLALANQDKALVESILNE